MGTIWNNQATLCWVATLDEAVSVDDLDMRHLFDGTQFQCAVGDEPEQATAAERR